MVVLSLRNLILSVSLAMFATLTPFSNAAPTPPIPQVDACGVLGSKNSSSITYDDVSACYKAIPYDPVVASATLKTLHAFFNDYYVFRDSALTPDLKAPFSCPPVDIAKEFERIGQTKYTSDYSFHSDVSRAINGLYDAHASYNIDCYTAYAFGQPFALYAPVVQGRQSIRIYRDFTRRGYDDCEVVTIDGEDALTHLIKFADTLNFSKDRGVRLNQALASETFDEKRGVFTTSSGQYSERLDLPDKARVNYELKCTNNPTSIRLSEEWRVFALNEAQFTDVKSYVTSVCLPLTQRHQDLPSTKHLQRRELETVREHEVRKRQLYPVPKKSIFLDAVPSAPSEDPTGGDTDLPTAQQLVAGNGTVFYQLQSQPDVGVIVVHTHGVESEGELQVAADGLAAFHARNITKILFDFQGNGGGSVNFASFLVQLIFPNRGDLDKSLRSDLRITPSIQDLSAAVFNASEGHLYNAGIYLGLTTQAPYQNNDLFLHPVTLTRNGRPALYSNSTTLDPVTLGGGDMAGYPWTNNPANVRFLTDGRCGSACALSAHSLHKLYNVTSYGVGGVSGEGLSMFSFAGGAVSSLNDVNKVYAFGKVTSPLEPLPYKGDVNLPILEVYANGSDIPLEYDADQHPVNYRLAFDPVNARKRNVMWAQVTAHAWGQKSA
ncbi:hypothetical protein BX616_000678 [Lobosporangium transversale]|nr:hypothetical protein BX616_000678 [Lobosporangium transversale]